MKNNLIDIICLCVTAVLFGGCALWNLFQPDRPVFSESEKRELAAMPEFSIDALTDGSYFSGIAAFVSDTFPERDKLVELSRKMDVLKGIDYTVGEENSFELLNTSPDNPKSDDPDEEEIAAAFDDLFNNLEGSEETTTNEPDEPETDQPKADIAEKEETESSDDVSIIETTAETESAETTVPFNAEGEDNIYTVTAINLSRETIALTVGGSITVTAEVVTDNPEGAIVYWSTSDANVASVTLNPAGGVNVTAKAQGSCTLICAYGDDIRAECTVNVTGTTNNKEESESPPSETEKAEQNQYSVTAIHLSRQIINLTIGSGTIVTATVETDDPQGAMVYWTTSDQNVASVSVNPSGGVDVRANSVGSCTVTCSYNDDVYASCTVNVTEISGIINPDEENLRADFLTNGLFIYGDAVYNPAYFSKTNSKIYAQTAAYYRKIFGCRVSVVVAPVSSMVIDDPTITSKLSDQGEILDKMRELTNESVNFVDAYSKMYANRKDYLFFKSDHHWTARGAYYAYAAFAESVGYEPTPIDGFDYAIINEHYHGSMYSLTRHPRVKDFEDIIEAFYPRKAHTMTVTNANGGTNVYSSSIVESYSSYLSFIAGDNPYTVINVPDNSQDRNVLVLKDSYGDVFVPYLVEHYGNIIVADVRYIGFNLYEKLKDYGLTDIIFVNNIQAANSYSWPKMYMSAVGQILP